MASPASPGTLPGAALQMVMEREDGEVGEVGVEVVKQGELHRGFGVDDQLPGYPELMARLKNLEELSQERVESQG